MTYLGAERVMVPEFSLMMTLPASYNTVTYYGLGPDENTCDRCSGARLGRHTYSVIDNVTAYTYPQECGTRTGVRWAKVWGDDKGIRIASEKPMTFTVLPYTPQELENARHPYELPPVCKTVVRIGYGQMGVGGDNSWGARPHDEDMLWLEPGLKFTFTISDL